MYHTINTNIGEVIKILKEIFPQDRTKDSTFLAAQNLLPLTELATEGEVHHQWAGTFSQTIEEVRSIIEYHKKAFPSKSTFHIRIKRLLYPSNEKDTAPLQSYVTRVVETPTKEAKKLRNMQKGYAISMEGKTKTTIATPNPVAGAAAKRGRKGKLIAQLPL